MTGAIEQNLVLQATIAANSSGTVGFDIPTPVDVLLIGYGYSWVRSCTFQLDTGQTQLPKRSDQEGSTSQPAIFGIPFECRSGGRCQIIIENNNSSDQTITALFKIRTTRLIEEQSSGGELIINTGLQGSNLLPAAVISYAVTGSVNSSEIVGIIQDMYDPTTNTFFGVSSTGPNSGSNGIILSVDLGSILSSKVISYAFLVSSSGASNAGEMTIETSTDNATWTTLETRNSLVSGNGKYSAQELVSSVRYIRVTMTMNRGGAAVSTQSYMYFLSVI